MKPWQAAVLDFVTYLSPNLVELRSMYHTITSNSVPSSSTLGNSCNSSYVSVQYIVFYYISMHKFLLY